MPSAIYRTHVSLAYIRIKNLLSFCKKDYKLRVSESEEPMLPNACIS
ncbi:hypothetical protein OTSKARP_1481 [Orientia tsutsugamushi str. Karp]|nr:hypothetical protein OTSKARP_1481 [Orientia tsutsugamushi str. Karp]